MYSRVAHSAAKLCALLTIAESDASLEYVVTEDVVERATLLMEWILESTNRTYQEHLVFEKYEQKIQRLLGFIGFGIDGIEKGKLLRKMRVPATELANLIGTLKDRGEVTEDTLVTAGRYKTVFSRIPEMMEPERRNGHHEEVSR